MVTPMENRATDLWWLFLIQGLAAVVLGLMLVTEPGATVLALVTVIGFYWLISGILSLVRMFVDRTVSWALSLIVGIVGILAGIVVLNHPLLAAFTLPAVIVIVLGIQGLVIGAIQIVHAFSGGGIGPFALGAINIIIAALLLASPAQAAMAVPVVFGFLLVIQGIVVSAWSLRLHQFAGEMAQHGAGTVHPA